MNIERPDKGMSDPKCQCALCKRLIEQHEVVSNACQECVNELYTLKAEVAETLTEILKYASMLMVQDVKALLTLKKKVGG